jgi:hypothetical protein
MRLKVLFSALGITAVLASGAGTFHATRTNPSGATHSGAATVALVTAYPSKMTSDGIGWD